MNENICIYCGEIIPEGMSIVDKNKKIMENLFHLVSVEIYDLLDEDPEDIVDAITDLAEKVEKLSDDIWEDEIIYKRFGSWENDWKFSLT